MPSAFVAKKQACMYHLVHEMSLEFDFYAYPKWYGVWYGDTFQIEGCSTTLKSQKGKNYDHPTQI